MSRLTSKKFLALVAALGAIAVAGGAYAYFTSPGSGSGTAAVGTSSQIELSNTPVGTLYPGGADVPVSVSVHNPGSGNQYVGTISGAVADNGSCLGSWFAVDPITFNTDVSQGATVTAGPTNVRMLDSNTNQDACKGLTMTIDWTSN